MRPLKFSLQRCIYICIYIYKIIYTKYVFIYFIQDDFILSRHPVNEDVSGWWVLHSGCVCQDGGRPPANQSIEWHLLRTERTCSLLQTEALFSRPIWSTPTMILGVGLPDRRPRKILSTLASSSSSSSLPQARLWISRWFKKSCPLRQRQKQSTKSYKSVIIIIIISYYSTIANLIPQVSEPRQPGKTKTRPPSSSHTPHYSWNHRGSSDSRCFGPQQQPMAYDWSGGSTGFSFQLGTQLVLISRSDLRSGRLTCRHVILWLSDIWRHSVHCGSVDTPTGSGRWEEAAPLCTGSLFAVKTRWDGDPQLGLRSSECRPASGVKPCNHIIRDEQGATLPSADRTA